MTARRLFLVRHGQVDFTSREYRTSPRGRQWDPPLGERGREQVELLTARLLRLNEPLAIFSSPFRRCVETIEPYAEAIGIKMMLYEDLGEVYMAEWEGKSFEEMVAGDEDLARRFREQEVLFSLSGGESGEELRRRVHPAVESILSLQSTGDVAIVAHGGVINAYVTAVMGFDHDMLFGPDNTSLSIIAVDADLREVRFLNDVRHLTTPEMFR